MTKRNAQEQLPPGFLKEAWVSSDIPLSGVIFFNPTPGTEGQSVPFQEVTTTLLLDSAEHPTEQEVIFPAPLADRATRLKPGDRIAAVVDIHIKDSLDLNHQPQRTTRVEVKRFERQPTPPPPSK